MNTITASTWGERLSTRFLGELVRREIEHFLDRGQVVVDFANVRNVGQSFADECFGVLWTERGERAFRQNISVINADEDTRAVIRFVLALRKNRAPA